MSQFCYPWYCSSFCAKITSCWLCVIHLLLSTIILKLTALHYGRKIQVILLLRLSATSSFQALFTVQLPSFHNWHSTPSPPLWALFCCEHSHRPSLPSVFLCNLILPLLLLEQFDLNAELQLSQSCCSCRLSVRSRLFAFSSLDKEKRRNLPSSLTE